MVVDVRQPANDCETAKSFVASTIDNDVLMLFCAKSLCLVSFHCAANCHCDKIFAGVNF